jgi:hypothetical protein
VEPTEKLVTSFSQMLKKQNKEVSDILTQGQNLVDEIEKTLVKAL